LGHPVSVVRCGRHNLKITTAEDLALARILVERVQDRPNEMYTQDRHGAGQPAQDG